jgi:myosin I
MEDTTTEFNIGVLDIYGFEIFQHNNFEQICINFVNEKLQQIFIELTLKSEQEEYEREQIPWEHIKYFNNKPCVELIEKRGGILSILDEECTLGHGTDETFLTKLISNCRSNEYFSAEGRSPSGFTMKHYAGQVNYNTSGWLDKNKDTLYNDLQTLLETACNNPFIQQLYPPQEIQSKKRPPTAGSQFKVSFISFSFFSTTFGSPDHFVQNQVTALVETLMSCHPHYIRCIRPNTLKAPKNVDMVLTMNQVQYLGLAENVRVRRAGFVYRETFAKFYRRFLS